MIIEEWKYVNVFNIIPNRYKVSSYGNIIDTNMICPKPHKPEYISNNGYDYTLMLTSENKFKLFHVDELVYLLFNNDNILINELMHKPNDGKFISIVHLDGNTRNNQFDNLSLQNIDEIWVDINYKDIKPNMYQVSNFGRIKNKIANHMMYMNNEKGYYSSGFSSINNNSRKCRINIIVANVFIFNDNTDKCYVNHIDGDKSNNSYRNLEWVTSFENHKHARLTGLKQSKLTENDVNLICVSLLNHDGYSNKVYNDLINIIPNLTKSSISDIKYKNTWNAVSDKYFDNTTFDDIFHKLTIEDVYCICEYLVEYNGDQSEVFNKLKNKISYLNKDDITDIKHKRRYTSVSDKYFDDNAFMKFQRKLTIADIILICKLLLKYNGLSGKVYNEIHKEYSNISLSDISAIKYKNKYSNISDQYFDIDTFAKYIRKYTKDDIIKICECLVKHNGNAIDVINELCDDNSNITPKAIYNIKCKATHVKISDKYFKYENKIFTLIK